MLEHSIYSVISPEGAASILWRDASKAMDVAAAMRITASDLQEFGIIDDIITEPSGGAHRDPELVIDATGEAIRKSFAELSDMDADALKAQRHEKFLAMGRNLI